MVKRRADRPLTERQQQVMAFIAGEVARRGRPPTLREIGARFRIGSTNGVRSLLSALERKGCLRRRRYLSRGIELLRMPEDVAGVVRVPIVGRVAAGQPLFAEENLDGELLIDRDVFKVGDGFALRVKGESMVGAGIFDGDLVLARPNLPLRAGDVVVALLGDEATVKHYYLERGRIRLKPANSNFEPIIIKKGTPDFHIAGKVVGLFRRY